MTTYRAQLEDTISSLVDPYEQTASYRYMLRPGEIARARTHPSLLAQLNAARMSSRAAADAGLRTAYASRPSARIEALDRLRAIDMESRACLILATMHPGKSVELNLRMLAVSDRLRGPILTVTLSRARAWVTWAELATGWEVPARHLREPCPLCAHRGGIRVRVEPRRAWCTNCHHTWNDAREVDDLAEHVRWYNGEAIA